MSEIINNSRMRIEQLKKLILDIHKGISIEEAKKQLMELMGAIPYGEVVQAEQELINEGLPETEILQFCDLHSQALKGNIDTSGVKSVPAGHPVDTFKAENREIEGVIKLIRKQFLNTYNLAENDDCSAIFLEMHSLFNQLMDIEKHYVRKENLLFPYLEKYGITGPPAVMWGKHDEIRAFLKSANELFRTDEKINSAILSDFMELMFEPTANAISEMIYKEEEILFPMCLDTLSEIEWYEIYSQSSSVGYTLVTPMVEWKPENLNIEDLKDTQPTLNVRVQLSTGSFSVKELEAFFKALPVDITFVDKDDKVIFFSEGKDRIFERSRAIIGRQVQYCHPPSSVHIVEKILSDFRSGKQSNAKFWINFKGMYVHIAYYAVRDEDGNYLGTLEVTQNIAEYRKIDGDRRLLTYDEN